MVVLSVLGKLLKWLLILFVALAAIGALWQQWSLRQDDKRYPAPGQLVSVGSHKLHIYCQGEASTSPVVLLDGGATFISTGWQWVMEDLSQTTRVCAYDRAGIGWSEEGVQPFDGPQMAKELHTLLKNAGIQTPVIYVGHSLGGNLGRIHYNHYPEDMAGLVMIEPGDPDIFLSEVEADRGEPVVRTEGIRPCGNPCAIGSIAAHLGIVRIALTQVDMLDDARFPQAAVSAYKARMSRPENIRQPLSMGRYVTRIMYQTRDNTSFGDMPVMGIYSTGFGSLLGAQYGEQTIKDDLAKNVAAWKRTTATSSRDMGVRSIEGGNHLAVIGYREHASQVSDHIREMIDEIERDAS